MAFGTTTGGLKRTTAEKLILRNITAIERSISDEKNPERKEELSSQLRELKGHLSRASGTTYSELMFENAELKKQVEEAKQRLFPLSISDQDASAYHAEEAREKLYRVLLGKYAELINENEKKTVGEIKSIISKDDLTVQSLANSFIPDNYKFESHFFQAAEKAYNYVRDEIRNAEIDLNISFWLSPKEIISEKIGDDEDQAVLLCSLLFALGDEKAEVVIAELKDASSHAFVITEFKGRFLLLDPTQGKPFRDFFGEKKDVLETYSFNGFKINRFLFRFNNSNYEQF